MIGAYEKYWTIERSYQPDSHRYIAIVKSKSNRDGNMMRLIWKAEFEDRARLSVCMPESLADNIFGEFLSEVINGRKNLASFRHKLKTYVRGIIPIRVKDHKQRMANLRILRSLEQSSTFGIYA